MVTAKKKPARQAKNSPDAPKRGKKQGSKSIEAVPREPGPGLSELEAGKPEKRKHGRPSDYSDDLADRICARIASGESLLTICKGDDMPARGTVMRWLAEDKHEGFCDKYVRAREAQADFYAEEIIAISDEECTYVKHGDGDELAEVEVAFDATAVARNRLRVDARKWYASKVAPKKYGDKLAVGGADDMSPLTVVVKKYGQ